MFTGVYEVFVTFHIYLFLCLISEEVFHFLFFLFDFIA